MTTWAWDERIDYLRRTRGLYYNDDYLQFLVERVWLLDRPVNLIDYGCGYGYMGLKLLELLPTGSTYTGVDRGERLIEEAKRIYAELPYETRFVCADIRTWKAESVYDVALCHAVLLHLEDPKATLRSMIERVKPGGKVLVFEPHWISSMANQWLEGTSMPDVVPLGILQKLFERDAERTGRDGNVGLKAPAYLAELGLVGVDCRVSDKVNFVLPQSPDEALTDALREEGIGGAPGDRSELIAGLTARGLTTEEAEAQYEAEAAYASSFDGFANGRSFVYAPTMKITYGTVP
ncbi:class I SAM-dependent methyltransferase [Cohnella sp. REN36]|uniref:class I SAM-dependent methyltransferase n=1 Tax=Cohnella sp. REN36 TaxID=2887347 RepID=UPI001D13D1A7|nr:class I SAM-dependent methyltransferase [Cohnella sp. REN36]MCC3371666.1 class I SAM-dependent methyltransferase [Cohnella sp. REN36]